MAKNAGVFMEFIGRDQFNTMLDDAISEIEADGTLSPERLAKARAIISGVDFFGATQTRAQKAVVENPSRKVRFFEEISQNKVPWLVNGIVPAGGLVVVGGAPNAGKSFVAIDLAMALCSYGQKFMGRSCDMSSVLYVTCEGLGDFGSRLAAAWEYRKTPECSEVCDFGHYGEPVDLRSPVDIDALIEEARTLGKATLEPCRLIVIDTLADSTAGVDENSSAEMGAALDNVARLMRATNATVVLVHHSAKSGDTLRGSGVLRAKADTVLRVAGNAVEIEKSRYGAKGLKLPFTLVPMGESRVVQWDTEQPATPGIGIQAEIIKAIADNPGISQRQLAKMLGKASSPINRVVKNLAEQGLVTTGNNGCHASFRACSRLVHSRTGRPLT